MKWGNWFELFVNSSLSLHGWQACLAIFSCSVMKSWSRVSGHRGVHSLGPCSKAWNPCQTSRAQSAKESSKMWWLGRELAQRTQAWSYTGNFYFSSFLKVGSYLAISYSTCIAGYVSTKCFWLAENGRIGERRIILCVQGSTPDLP